MKLETWLRMAQVPYVIKRVSGPPKSKSGKMPYVERPDGELLADSSLIIETLTQERGVKLDEGLSAMERAQGILIQRLLEEELYFHILYDRWHEPKGWELTGPAYFGKLPWAVRNLVVPMIRRKVIAAMGGQGVSRLPDDYRRKKGIADVGALAGVLGEQPYFLGRPSSIDAAAYGFLANCLWTPVPSPISDAVRSHPNLVRFCERMKESYWQGWSAPA